jgi:hypothetical protein
MTEEVQAQPEGISSEGGEVNSENKVMYAKLFATTLFGVCLCSFGPFGLFSPAAFAFAFLSTDFLKALAVQVIVFIVCSLLFGTSFFLSGGGILAIYACLIGMCISFFIKKKVPPMFLVLNAGTFFVLLACFFVGAIALTSEKSIYQLVFDQVTFYINQLKDSKELGEVLNLGGEQAIILKSFLSSPEKITLELLSWSPAVFISGTFLSIWISLYYVLRNSFSWRKRWEYPFGVVHFTFFKLPFFFVYLVIIGLLLTVAGEYISSYVPTVGLNLLYVVGTLYFFQGFGVCYDFFVIKRIRGFLRSFSLMFILIFAWRALVLLGLLDNWFNFRKYFLNKNEGDK